MRRTMVIAAMAAAVLSVAACGEPSNTPTGTTTTAGPTTSAAADEAAAWMDKVCGELVELIESQPPPPPNLAEGDQQQVLDRFDRYLAENIEVVNRAINDLTQLGEPPVRAGAQVVNALGSGLAAMRDSLQGTKDKIAAIDTGNPQQAQAAVLDALESLEQGSEGFDRAAESIQTNKDLEQAIDAAPNCQKLDSTTSTTSGTATSTTTTTT